MHLSLLSDSFLSDRLNDAGIRPEYDFSTAGRAHRDGVVRGLCFAAALALPVILTFGAPVADRAASALVSGVRMASPTVPVLPARAARSL